MAKIKAIMKYMGSQEGVKWHDIKWTFGKEVEFTEPEDILAVRSFMKRPDVGRNWYIRVEEVPIIGATKTVAEVKATAPAPVVPQPAKELEKAKDALDEVLAETKPTRNYSWKNKGKKKQE